MLLTILSWPGLIVYGALGAYLLYVDLDGLRCGIRSAKDDLLVDAFFISVAIESVLSIWWRNAAMMDVIIWVNLAASFIYILYSIKTYAEAEKRELERMERLYWKLAFGTFPVILSIFALIARR